MNEKSTKQDAKTLGFAAGTDNESSGYYEPVGRTTDVSGVRSAGVKASPIAWRGQRPIVDRFWSKVNKAGHVPEHRKELGPCWLWTGCVVARYGQISLGHPHTRGSKRWKAHRFSWELHRGPVPDGLVVRHQCDNCLCVNPSHLELGTQKQNVHDGIRRGRRNAWGIQKLNPDDVRVIRAQAARGIPQKDIAKAFGVARNTVSQIVNRTTWAHLLDGFAAARQAS
jgi:hypothetical protein